jgi:hypothetical protein
MQSLLFLLEEADAQLRDGKPHLALKKYMAVKMVSSFVNPVLLCTYAIDSGV